MITDRDLRNQLVYAIKTSDFDALAGVIADMISKGYDRGVDYGRRGMAEEIARKMLAQGVSKEDIAKFAGVNMDELSRP